MPRRSTSGNPYSGKEPSSPARLFGIVKTVVLLGLNSEENVPVYSYSISPHMQLPLAIVID